MDGVPALKKDWVVTQASFDLLLRQLDPDRERAGEKYEQVRQKLTKFFQWRGCTTPEEFADRTLDRAARRLGDGTAVPGQEIYPFVHGIAINVLREHWKEAQKHGTKSLDESPVAQNIGADPTEARERATEQAQRERRLECLDACVNGLPPPQLKLITEYHQGEGGARIARRNALAEELRIPLNALRIRAHRIRGELETCISECTRREAASK